MKPNAFPLLWEFLTATESTTMASIEQEALKIEEEDFNKAKGEIEMMNRNLRELCKQSEQMNHHYQGNRPD